MSTDNNRSEPLDPALRFETAPYRAEGGSSVPGLAWPIVLTLGGGLVAAFVASWIGQWFYLIGIFPIVTGSIIGGCGGLGGYIGKLRNPPVALAIGILGGCLATVAMHWFDFRWFLIEQDKTNPGALDLQFSASVFADFIDASAVAG